MPTRRSGSGAMRRGSSNSTNWRAACAGSSRQRVRREKTMSDATGGFGIDEVMRRLPHRYPMLLVDRVLECEAGSRIVALKNVTANEQFFSGHFPGRPVMPGVIMLEALAQAAGILCFVTAGIYPDENVKFYF